MADYTALTVAWTARIANISDAVIQAEATALLSEYIEARTAYSDLAAGKVQSYSVAGRTFTYRDARQFSDLVRRMANDLDKMCHGGTVLVDLSGAMGGTF